MALFTKQEIDYSGALDHFNKQREEAIRFYQNRGMTDTDQMELNAYLRAYDQQLLDNLELCRSHHEATKGGSLWFSVIEPAFAA